VKSILVITVVLFGSLLNAQSFQWVAGLDSINSSFVAADGEGNIYVTGQFYGTANFDPGEGVSNLSAIGLRDIYLQKYNSDGELLWAKSMEGTPSESSSANSIAVDGFGNVYITGSYSETVDFDPGLGLTTMTSSVSKDIFIQKISTNGELIWIKTIEKGYNDVANALELDDEANIYITGSFQSTADFDTGLAEYNLSVEDGGDDMFVLKLDSAGNLIWATDIGGKSGTNWAAGNDIHIPGDGSVYTTGYFVGTIDFDPTSDEELITSNGQSFGESDAFIMKQDVETGGLVWVKAFKGDKASYGVCVSVDTEGGVYCSGYFNGGLDSDPGPELATLASDGTYRDAYVVKLNMDGNFVFSYPISSSGNNGISAMDVDNHNDVYIGGGFQNTVDFDPSETVLNVTSVNESDLYLQKISKTGEFLSITTIGGWQTDHVNDMVILDGGSVVLTGDYSEVVDFDPSSGVNEIVGTLNEENIFLLKLGSTVLTVPEPVSDYSIIGYPSIVEEHFTLKFNDLSVKYIEVLSVNGLLVDKFDDLTQLTQVIKVADYSPGIYFVSIKSENRFQVIRFVKR
jgi:hypothetical protein